MQLRHWGRLEVLLRHALSLVGYHRLGPVHIETHLWIKGGLSRGETPRYFLIFCLYRARRKDVWDLHMTTLVVIRAWSLVENHSSIGSELGRENLILRGQGRRVSQYAEALPSCLHARQYLQ